MSGPLGVPQEAWWRKEAREAGENREAGQADTCLEAWSSHGTPEDMGRLSRFLTMTPSKVQPAPLQGHPASSLILLHSCLWSPEGAQRLVTGTCLHDAAMGTTTQSPLGFKMVIIKKPHNLLRVTGEDVLSLLHGHPQGRTKARGSAG